MKQKTLTLTGKVNSNGELLMYQGELQEFLKQWKDERVSVTFTIIQRNCSTTLKGYYYQCVVPQMQKALWENGERMTKDDTDKFLRKNSPICYEETPMADKGYHQRIKDIHELSNAEMIEHIETIKQLAAEEYGVYIEDPRRV